MIIFLLLEDNCNYYHTLIYKLIARTLQCVWRADEKLRNFQKSTKYGRFLNFANFDFQISGHEEDIPYAFFPSADQEFDEVFKNAKIYFSLYILVAKIFLKTGLNTTFTTKKPASKEKFGILKQKILSLNL